MKIVSCPKGGRVPKGYCLVSCLNYSGERQTEKSNSLRRIKNLFTKNGRSWLQIYKEEIALATDAPASPERPGSRWRAGTHRPKGQELQTEFLITKVRKRKNLPPASLETQRTQRIIFGRGFHCAKHTDYAALLGLGFEIACSYMENRITKNKLAHFLLYASPYLPM